MKIYILYSFHGVYFQALIAWTIFLLKCRNILSNPRTGFLLISGSPFHFTLGLENFVPPIKYKFCVSQVTVAMAPFRSLAIPEKPKLRHGGVSRGSEPQSEIFARMLDVY